MKNSILISLLFIYFSSALAAQESNYQPASSCSNYNAFAKSSQIEQVKPLVSAVRENGTLLLNPEKADSMDLLFQKLGVTTGTIFQLVKETKSRLDSTKFFRKYQQYYNGVEVDGGGYTTAYIGPNGPTDPCAEAYMMAPHILTEISLNQNPSVSPTSLASILQVQNVASFKLLITHNLSNQCEYKLVWKTTYFKEYPKISWVDAQTGIILKTIDATMDINAPTVTYGTQNLNDRTVGNTTTLETPDQRVVSYNFGNTCPVNPVNENEWVINFIPTTTANEWSNEGSPEIYQAFYVTSLAVPIYDSIGINFGVVNVATCPVNNAFSLFGSTVDNAFIEIGQPGGSTGALFDVIGHELGHTFLNEFLDYTTPGNQSLHESISDMLGTYVEFMANGNVDWVMGDDETAVANLVGRDLANPGVNFDCFTEVSNFGSNQRHNRSKPLGHWFFLISQGNQNISSLGIQHALDIILDALNLIESDSDYPDLMEATMTIVEDQFGRCSNEFLAVARAWEAICVPTGFAVNGVIPSCNFIISGPTWVCEESEYAQFCAQGGLPNYQFRFRIIGKKSTDYESVCGMQGNTQYGCTYLTLIDFPKYPYYPQYVTIELYSPQAGPQFTQRKRLKLVDCNGDDPTCEEYNELQNEEGEDRFSYNYSEKTDVKYIKVRAFDLMGRQVFEKNTNNLQRNELQYHGILILVFYSEKGEIVKVSKAFLTD